MTVGPTLCEIRLTPIVTVCLIQWVRFGLPSSTRISLSLSLAARLKRLKAIPLLHTLPLALAPWTKHSLTTRRAVLGIPRLVCTQRRMSGQVDSRGCHSIHDSHNPIFQHIYLNHDLLYNPLLRLLLSFNFQISSTLHKEYSRPPGLWLSLNQDFTVLIHCDSLPAKECLFPAYFERLHFPISSILPLFPS